MSANLIVGKDPDGLKVPVAVDATGAVVISGTVSSIGNVETILNAQTAIETVMAADLASVKTKLTTGTIAVTGGGGGATAAYNATLPTYTNGASSTLQTDVNGRLITTGTLTDTQLRASALPVSIASVPSHAVTNAGTFAVQNTSAVVGGNAVAVKTDGSAVTQPISAASLPLPTGSATSANQTTGNTSLSSIAGNTSSGSTAAVSSFTSVSSATIVASGTRKAITIYNAGAGDLYVLLGTGTASSTNYSFVVGVSDLVTVASYTGAIQGIFSATGTASISIIS